MNQKLIHLQLLGCGMLSLVLAAEWGYKQFSAGQLQTLLAPRAQGDFQAEELPSIANDKASAETYGEIVERPLFIEGRKPIPEANPIETAQSQDAGQIDDWALVGVYNKDKHPVALFSKRNEAKKFMKITEDQSISGWQLKQIQADRVLLQQAGQEKTVVLRKPRLQTKPPIPGKAAVPPRLPVPAAAPKPIEQVPTENLENINDN